MEYWEGSDIEQQLLCPKRDPGVEEEGLVWNCINKNRRYWPKGVHGDAINKYFRSKN